MDADRAKAQLDKELEIDQIETAVCAVLRKGCWKNGCPENEAGYDESYKTRKSAAKGYQSREESEADLARFVGTEGPEEQAKTGLSPQAFKSPWSP